LAEADSKEAGSTPVELCVDLTAIAKNDSVYNQTTFSKYMQLLRMGLPFCSIPNAFRQCAPDYPAYFASHFPPKCSEPEQLKQSLLRTFNEPGHKSLGFVRGLDLTGGFFGSISTTEPGIYQGKVCLTAVLACIAAHFPEFISVLEAFAVHTAETYGRMNALLGVDVGPMSTDCNPYRMYFSHISREQIANTSANGIPFVASDVYPYYFLCGMSWLNIVSANTRTLIPNALELAANNPDLIARNLKNGSLYLRCAADPLNTDIPDIQQGKRILYNALYPGRQQLRISDLYDTAFYSPPAKPRTNWELVPVDAEEIEVTDTLITLQHKNYNAPFPFAI